jgi:hypothetical protein
MGTLALARRGALPSSLHPTSTAVVEVDPETGTVTLLRYVVAHDCGKVITRSSWTARCTAVSLRAWAARWVRRWCTTSRGSC